MPKCRSPQQVLSFPLLGIFYFLLFAQVCETVLQNIEKCGIVKVVYTERRMQMPISYKKAEAEYDEFNKTQKITSDFDKSVKKMLESKGGKRDA